MPNLLPSGPLRRLSIALLLLSAAGPALAQSPAGAVVQPLSRGSDPAELLAQALRTLATEPSNLAALTAAGRNALILGDPNAAVGFFGRAQEIAPGDGRVKAGLGSALVQLERPQDALRLFADASRLGVPDADLAEDRGLAYDLMGDQARAQADYRTVLAAHPEDDTARRRLALSQGISGQKAAAIATLDPLIRKRDIAGWRAQTFVLAMDGDARGAGDITRIMLPQQAPMLQPFLVRLATLTPAQKARAVHFGEMPTTGATYTPTQVASVSAPATYAAAPARQPAPAPRSDLAPVVQVAPQPNRVVTAPVVTRVASAPALSTYAATAPLAGIALTPAAAAPAPPTAVGPTLSPATRPAQLAQATQPAAIAGSPMPAPDDLPTSAPVGHYDLPHDAATRAAPRPARPAPAPASVKTVGTPVVHGRTAAVTASADGPDAAPVAKAAKAPVRAASDDTDEIGRPARAKAGGSTASRTRPAIAEVDDEDDCTPAPASKRQGHGKAFPKKKTATACTRLAAEDDGATPKPKKGAKSKAAADDRDTTPGRAKLVDADDCAPATRTTGKARAKSRAATPSTACTRLTSADEDTGIKAKKSARTEAPTLDDGDERETRSSKSAKSAKAEKGAAERVYVQIAGGANRDDMDKAWAGVKRKAPELMKGKTPSTTPLKSTNRLLVGPFKDEDEAQAFVNKMAAKGLSGFTFRSGKGQKVEKIDSAP